MNETRATTNEVNKYWVYYWWKLHLDTSEPLADVPHNDPESGYFKVEGKRRPAILLKTGKMYSKVVLLTTICSKHVVELGKLKDDDDRISYFDPRRIEWHPNHLKLPWVVFELPNHLSLQFGEEMSRVSMTSRATLPPECQ